MKDMGRSAIEDQGFMMQTGGTIRFAVKGNPSTGSSWHIELDDKANDQVFTVTRDFVAFKE